LAEQSIYETNKALKKKQFMTTIKLLHISVDLIFVINRILSSEFVG